MCKKITLIVIVFLLFGCKTTKKADCDAYGHHKQLKIIESKTYQIKKDVR